MLCSNTVKKPIPLNNLCHPNHLLNSFCTPCVRSAVNFVCQNVLPFACLYVSWSTCHIAHWRLVYIRLSVCQAVRWRGCMSECLYDSLTIAVAMSPFVCMTDWPLQLLHFRLSLWHTVLWPGCMSVDSMSEFHLPCCPFVCLSSYLYSRGCMSVCLCKTALWRCFTHVWLHARLSFDVAVGPLVYCIWQTVIGVAICPFVFSMSDWPLAGTALYVLLLPVCHTANLPVHFALRPFVSLSDCLLWLWLFVLFVWRVRLYVRGVYVWVCPNVCAHCLFILYCIMPILY